MKHIKIFCIGLVKILIFLALMALFFGPFIISGYFHNYNWCHIYLIFLIPIIYGAGIECENEEIKQPESSSNEDLRDL